MAARRRSDSISTIHRKQRAEEDADNHRHMGYLATIWQQYWPCHPNATTMSKRCSRDVSSLKTRSFYVIPTCCQCHAHGRRAGLKIRSSQEGVGSSPTFGSKTSLPPNPRKGRGADRTAARGGLPRLEPLDWRIYRSIADDDARLTLALEGLAGNRFTSSPAVEGPRGGVG